VSSCLSPNEKCYSYIMARESSVHWLLNMRKVKFLHYLSEHDNVILPTRVSQHYKNPTKHDEQHNKSNWQNRFIRFNFLFRHTRMSTFVCLSLICSEVMLIVLLSQDRWHAGRRNDITRLKICSCRALMSIDSSFSFNSSDFYWLLNCFVIIE
jgi:hypothetical protein